MEWAGVVKTVSSAAPIIGSFFGPAGTAIGALAGTGIKLVATALGVEPTEAAVTQAIATDPEAALKLAKYEMDNKLELQRLVITAETARIQEETKVIQAINETMRGESASEHWPQYSWRPFWGFASGLAFFFVCILVCILAWQAVSGKDAAALGHIPLIIGAFATLFSIPGAILGIASWKRGEMQLEAKKTAVSG